MRAEALSPIAAEYDYLPKEPQEMVDLMRVRTLHSQRDAMYRL
ncbi:hypothetical protein HAPAU_35650 [Halalkalicoccus paucihalophilus]|uniref:Uncharacterized protein n=1 Tax=Halalkalicoccus paucihalophilus TaxID=1008153 RepID=A0A151AAR0_9EURY|nr:hypothetical protein HAPAU_35650 [Halalkalicoccus paucihalophilus]